MRQPIKVHVADDHQIVLDGILSFLEKEEEIEVVHTSNNGEEALEKIRKQPVDVAILDISMPIMNGLQAAQKILREYKKTKVLLLTMLGDSKFIINALKTGVHGYVTKEKSKEYLVGAIHSVFRGASYWSPEILAKISESDLDNEDDISEEPVRFTQREQQLLCTLVKEPGFTSEKIGEEFNIATVTVDTHLRNMRKKVKVKTRRELTAYALRNKLCE